MALTRIPDFWSATVIVATFALAGYRSPQHSQRKTTVRPQGSRVDEAMAVGRSKKNIHMEANLRPWRNVGQGSQCSSYRLPLDSGAFE